MKTKQILPAHHSTADWDYHAVNAATWGLDAVKFVTPPSSIQLTFPLNPIQPEMRIICNLLGTTDLKEGRLYTRHCINNIGAPGGLYFIYGSGNAPFIRARIMSVAKSVAWSWTRLSWWNSYNAQNEQKLAVRLDRYLAGAWDDGEIGYDDRLTEGVNRVGIGGFSGVLTIRLVNFDDTEIWTI